MWGDPTTCVRLTETLNPFTRRYCYRPWSCICCNNKLAPTVGLRRLLYLKDQLCSSIFSFIMSESESLG
ncbi:hypothetical protein HanHA300_Chr03g0089261 [Helianthus annuus]|nr:hypothetical protein HanHA300_Chr03g0089261 [Helianthus annuus]KAJ0607792.1 hypothetical protein HanHA89_Chr03g0100861 [Helianthus annuus]KAJ0767856.1 hypothetical protein HanLR1_Chr03g0094231 [Helianthus annuus]